MKVTASIFENEDESPIDTLRAEERKKYLSFRKKSKRKENMEERKIKHMEEKEYVKNKKEENE